MPDREKLLLLIRLAMLEKEHGKELRKVEDNFRSDYIGIPVLKKVLQVTAVFILLFCLWAVYSIDFLMEILASGKLGLLLTGILSAYAVILLLTAICTFLYTSARYYKSSRLEKEYRSILQELAALQNDNGL